MGISAKEIEIAGGLYHPEPDQLLAVRQRIFEHAGGFRATFAAPRVRKLIGELQGESAARAPKGFPADHPDIDLIRRKQYLLYTMLDPAVATTPKLLREVVSRFEAIAPFVRFLNEPLLKKSARDPFATLEFRP